MCGGAIIADFIPRRGRSLAAADIWPKTLGKDDDFGFGYSNIANPQRSSLKIAQPPKG